MHIQLSPAITISTDRAESSYGQPVLVIDGIAYGYGDDFGARILEEETAVEQASGGEFAKLCGLCSAEQVLVSMCGSACARGSDEDALCQTFINARLTFLRGE